MSIRAIRVANLRLFQEIKNPAVLGRGEKFRVLSSDAKKPALAEWGEPPTTPLTFRGAVLSFAHKDYMKRIIFLTACSFFLILGTIPGYANEVEFIWTAQSGYDPVPGFGSLYFNYLGTDENGVFVPTSLISASPILGLPKGSSVQWSTDTPYGPSFQLTGTIQPIASEDFFNFYGDDITLQGGIEKVTWFDTSPNEIYTQTGVWTEVTGIPDAGSSAVLLGMALTALCAFPALRRNSSRPS